MTDEATIAIGRGQISPSILAVDDLMTRPNLLTAILGSVATPKFTPTGGRFIVSFVVDDFDKYLAMPLSDIVGREVALAIYATPVDASRYGAAVLDEKVETRAEKAKRGIAARRYVKGLADYLGDDD